MAEAFPVSGNIEPASFPHLLVDLHRHGATGSLKVTGPVHPKALYFRGGRILFGSSNDPRDQLGAILIESGRITREQLDEVNLKVGPGNPLAKVLAESGFVNQRELGDAARVKVERILADLLSWEAGSFEFEDGVLPKGAVDLKLSTERLLLAATQRVPDRAFALRHVDLGAVLEPAPEGETALSEIRAEVWPLLERLDGHRTLKDAVALTRLDEFEAAKTACALLLLGIVRRKEQGGQELDLAEEAQSGFGTEGPMYTVPVEAVSLPAPEATGFSFAEPEAEPAPFPVVEPEPEAAAETVMFPFPQPEPLVEPSPELSPFADAFPPPPVLEAPAAIPDAPSFTMDAPRRKPTDTVPGDRPVYVPPAPEPEPLPATVYEMPAPTLQAPEIGTPSPVPASRPTQEDLAALDALLNPSASGRLPRTPVDRPQPEKWEPQFRPPTTPPRKAPAPRGRILAFSRAHLPRRGSRRSPPRQRRCVVLLPPHPLSRRHACPGAHHDRCGDAGSDARAHGGADGRAHCRADRGASGRDAAPCARRDADARPALHADAAPHARDAGPGCAGGRRARAAAAGVAARGVPLVRRLARSRRARPLQPAASRGLRAGERHQGRERGVVRRALHPAGERQGP